jgi:Uncharacterised nucleotidyltransferase
MIARRCRPFDLVSRVFAERLQGCEPSDGLRFLVRSQSIDWERVVGHVSAQFVLPAFAAALDDLDLTGSLDDELSAFLDVIHAANVERNLELSDELAAAVGILNRAGIEPVLLKGAIRLVDALYPDIGWRMLRDLDLLIPEARFTHGIELLQAAGYALAGEVRESVPVRRRGALVEVELHRALFSRPEEVRLLQAREMLDGSRPAAFGDVCVRLPSIEHQIMHLIGHSQLRHYGHAFGRIAWRDRLEAAALIRAAPGSIDWQAVLTRFAAAGYRRLLLSFLLALNDGLCTVQVPGKPDPLTAFQQRRIALQARSTIMAHVGLWAAWSATKLKWQITERDAGRLRAIKNVKRLIFEGGATRRMARAFFDQAPRPW